VKTTPRGRRVVTDNVSLLDLRDGAMLPSWMVLSRDDLYDYDADTHAAIVPDWISPTAFRRHDQMEQGISLYICAYNDIYKTKK
jgi:hypothetical protein